MTTKNANNGTENTKTLNVTFCHPRSSDTFEAEIGAATTGAQAIDELRRANWLPDPGRGAFALSVNNASVDLEKPLATQGVTNGSRVQVILTGVAGRGGASS